MDKEDIGVVGTPGSAKAPHSKLSPPEAVANPLIGAILTAIVLLLVERMLGGGILVSHVLGIMKPTTLSQPKPILGQQAEAPDDPPDVPFKPYKTADKMRALLEAARKVTIGMPRTEVFALLGQPSRIVNRGDFGECTWSMEENPGDFNCRVTVTLEKGTVCSFHRKTGRLLMADEMQELFDAAAQSLRLKMTIALLPPAMQDPSSTFIQALPKVVGPVDPITHEVAMGTQIMEVREWYRAGDPGACRATVAFMDGALFRTECCDSARGTFFLLGGK